MSIENNLIIINTIPYILNAYFITFNTIRNVRYSQFFKTMHIFNYSSGMLSIFGRMSKRLQVFS